MMVSITALWLPILFAAVVVFIASSIIHMVLPYHRSDYRKLPDEEKVSDALRAVSVTPGPVYHFPHCTHKDMKSPEVIEKFKRGPVGLITILPSGQPAMGKYLGLWFGLCLLISVVIGCFAITVLRPGEEHHHVFHFFAVAAFLAYGFGNFQESIWKGQTWVVTLKHLFDALIYALLTAETFSLLWPR